MVGVFSFWYLDDSVSASFVNSGRAGRGSILASVDMRTCCSAPLDCSAECRPECEATGVTLTTDRLRSRPNSEGGNSP